MTKYLLAAFLILLSCLLVYYFGSLFYYITSGLCVYTFRSVLKTALFCVIYLSPFVFFEKSIREINKYMRISYIILGVILFSGFLLHLVITCFHDHNH